MRILPALLVACSCTLDTTAVLTDQRDGSRTDAATPDGSVRDGTVAFDAGVDATVVDATTPTDGGPDLDATAMDGGPSVPDPLEIFGSDLALWWKPGEGLSTAAGGVSSWTDRVAGLVASGTSSEFPEEASDARGRTCPAFPNDDSDADGLVVDRSTPIPTFAYDGTGACLAAVWFVSGDASTRVVLDGINLTVATNPGIAVWVEASRELRITAGGSNGSVINYTGNRLADGWHSLLLRHGGSLSDYEIYVDESLVAMGRYGNTPAGVATTPFHLGSRRRATITQRSDGPLADVILAQHVGSPAQIADLLRYLALVRTGR